MKDISPILRSLGLADSEVKVYLAALANGAGTAIDLSKQARVSRQAVYLAIEELEKRGLMSSVVHGKKRMYSAEHPANLLDFAKRKQQEITEQIGDLERSIPDMVLGMGGEKPVVKVFQGKEGIRVMIDEMRNSVKGEYLEISDLDPMYKVLSPEDLKPLRDAVQEVKTQSKLIYVGTPKKHLSDIDRHFLPTEMGGFKTNLTIFSDKVFCVTFEGKMTSLIIESPLIAKTLRTLFLLAFETAKKYPRG